MRWRVHEAGALPGTLEGKCYFVGRLLMQPWCISAILATFLGGITWMLAMTKFEISYAYPWISLGFVLVMFFGFLLFGESFSVAKLIGTCFVVVGLIILARG
jgi:multidrug transporter EmrE-like cation transporter